MERPIFVGNHKNTVKNLNLISLGFATAFFPRLFTFFGAPDPLNFVHLLIVPAIAIIAISTTGLKNRKQIVIAWELIFGLAAFFTCMLASAILNEAGIINVVLQFILFGEPYLLVLALISVPIEQQRLIKLRNFLLGSALFNLLLALAQSVLLPLGIYPHKGGTLADATAGVFASGPGSAGNYVSCTVSIYFAIYALSYLKRVPLWMRSLAMLAALYQTHVSDSKQVFLALMLGLILMFMVRLKNPLFLLGYVAIAAIGLYSVIWIVQNVDVDALSAYRNWVSRPGLYGPDGEATRTKFAAFYLVPQHFDSLLDWLFGLGPGHTVTRLGGWLLPKYASMLEPFGATVHPVSGEVFQVVTEGWIAQESTIFFPLFTWAGLWGDFGIVGLAIYIYLGFVVWHRVCVDDLGRFMVMSTIVLGFILTQMEEPGHMLTIAMLLGLRWHEKKQKLVELGANKAIV